MGDGLTHGMWKPAYTYERGMEFTHLPDLSHWRIVDVNYVGEAIITNCRTNETDVVDLRQLEAAIVAQKCTVPWHPTRTDDVWSPKEAS